MRKALMVILVVSLLAGSVYVFAAGPFVAGGSGGTVTSTSVVAAFGSGSCSGYLKSDGNCDTPASALSGGAQYYLPVWTAADSIGKLAAAGTAGNPLISGGAAANPSWLAIVLAGGTNTFNISNGTASLDVAAGAALNIDTSLQTTTGAIVLAGQAGGSSVTLPATGTLLAGNGDGSALTGLQFDQFITQTAWRMFYSNADGDVTELAFGDSGKVLQSNGAAAAPTWETAGAGNVSKVGTPSDHQWGQWTGDGTLAGVTITASKPVCSDSDGAPTVCAGTEYTAIDLTAKSVTTIAAAATGGYVRLKEGSDNGTDYSSITGAADAGSNPSFTFAGSAAGSEDLTLTATADTWTASSTTGVTSLNLSAMNLVTTGSISGGIPVAVKSAETTLSGTEARGYMIMVTTSNTVTLPTAETGMSCCVYSSNANLIRVKPGAGDTLYLNGASVHENHSVYSASAAGDFLCVLATSTSSVVTLGRSGTWTDSGF